MHCLSIATREGGTGQIEPREAQLSTVRNFQAGSNAAALKALKAHGTHSRVRSVITIMAETSKLLEGESKSIALKRSASTKLGSSWL